MKWTDTAGSKDFEHTWQNSQILARVDNHLNRMDSNCHTPKQLLYYTATGKRHVGHLKKHLTEEFNTAWDLKKLSGFIPLADGDNE